MREIKYRGLSINGKTFVGNLTILRKRWDHLEEGYYISNSAGMPFAYQVRPETIGEYTGLKDKNGKEIFEGDIIRGNGDTLFVDWNVFLASFCINKNGWAFSHFFGEAINPNVCEVIGNIHENYELLEVKPAVTQWNLETPKCKCGGKVILVKEKYRCDCGNVFTKI